MDCTDPKIVRKIKMYCWVLLALCFVIDLICSFVYPGYIHPHFPNITTIDTYSYLFYPIFGFVGCVLMVVGAKKLISTVLKRKDTYYEQGAVSEESEAGGDNA
ncbi:MAG: hypothetical protein HRU15_05295 [Planctomycetes bacterium]|nr:hypothetical protein [Planctomycetota bacterium]